MIKGHYTISRSKKALITKLLKEIRKAKPNYLIVSYSDENYVTIRFTI